MNHSHQRPSSRRRFTTALAASALVATVPALAQDGPFPSRTLRIIVPTAPGGNHDLLGRLLAEKLQAAWGQRVVVENRAGGNTTLATVATSSAPADGYTALLTISGFVQNLVLQQNPQYKASDFEAVSMIAAYPIAMAVNVQLPVRSLADLVQLARRQPGQMTYGTYGAGSGAHVIGEGLNKAADIKINHVPYKGEAPSYPDLVSNQIQIAYGSVGFYGQRLTEGKVRLLAIASPTRMREYPDVQTFAEAGYPDLNLAGWGGVLMAAGTPAPILDKWSQELQRIVQMPDVQKRLSDWGFVPAGTDRATFAKTIDTDLGRWREIVRANDIRID